MLSSCATTAHENGLAGAYRLDGGPDVAGQLLLGTGGRFTYMLAAGALDEHAHGRWETKDDAACLFTEPKPVPPEFSRVSGVNSDETGHLTAIWPNGEGIAGVDFRLGLGDGSVIEGYTQQGGWDMADGDNRKLRWVELSVPMHGINSPRFEIDQADGGPWSFLLTPNDLGVVDFDGQCLRRNGRGFILERDGGTMPFARAD